ncbi:hypothetical protein TrVE_jg1517 [Triparma verrucosa]|uniref:Uncharacterized protein n=1 Tax=Triparma verrucosa TaxID=1606542 RepID=A0A9W7C759_9STRA|nr:hypothetical protein TrVE_jg1517 [Triparma verrucosa]
MASLADSSPPGVSPGVAPAPSPSTATLNPVQPSDQFISTPDFILSLLPYVFASSIPAFMLVSKEISQGTQKYVEKSINNFTLKITKPNDPAVRVMVNLLSNDGARRTTTSRVIIFPSPETNPFCCFKLSLLMNIDLPSSITTLKTSTFENCTSLKHITLSPNLTTVEPRVFKNCSSLSTLDLSSTKLTLLEQESFAACSSLRTLTVPNWHVTLGDYVFINCSDLVSSDVDSCDSQKVWSFLKMEEERRRERFLEYPREKWNDSDYY